MQPSFRLLICPGLVVAVGSGCGLVWIPYEQRFPSPVQAIRVVDAENRLPVPDARVTFRITKAVNWTHFAPRAESCQVDATSEDRSRQQVDIRQEADLFLPEHEVSLVGWVGWFFPIPSPLGWTLYEDHQGCIEADAPGYRRLCLVYSPALPPQPGQAEWASVGPGISHPSFTSDGVLTLYVARTESGGRPGHDVEDTVDEGLPQSAWQCQWLAGVTGAKP